MTTPQRWQEIDRIFAAALVREPAERAAFLDQACGGDEQLRKEVESLIAHDVPESLVGGVAVGEATRLLARDKARALTGERIGPYVISKSIGAGGMGEVYLAKDRLGRMVALKLLNRHFERDKSGIARFQQEAQTLLALNHPHIVTIYDIDQADNVYYIASELVEGETLRQRLDQGEIALEEYLEIAIQVATALAAAHEKGIVHRDIKPENIMIRRDGYVKVLDFGIAKLTEPPSATDPESPTIRQVNTAEGVVVGTAAYMSPEQARGLPVDARTDIFSLGVVIYEMVAAHLPFEGSTASDVMASILNDKEAHPLARYTREVPAELERIVEKALRKDRDQRYQSIKDMLLDLRTLKHKLEVNAEIERTGAPDHVMTNGERAPAATKTTAPAAASQKTSSAEYIVKQVGLHKRGVIIALGAIILATSLTSLWYFKHARAAPLTEKDTILLVDFVNTTGDQVFDGTLKQALAIQLEQSPYLSIVADGRVLEALRFMQRSPDDRVTKDVAREICERQGLKAYIAGSISNLGSHFVITLEAVNAQTADTLAREQVEAESKEQVLSTLGQAAIKLREKLGESLASIQKYDAMVEATTSSLDALNAYSLGRDQSFKGKDPEALTFFKRAVELDPNFARAYDGMLISYSNLMQRDLAIAAGQKAFDLRDRTSAYEKLKIASDYYWSVTGELDKSIEATELLTRTYPRDSVAHHSLAVRYLRTTQYEKAIEEEREAIRLYPNSAYEYEVLAESLQYLNRFAEEKQAVEQALALKLDTAVYHRRLYQVAFVQRDATEMQQQLDWTRGKQNEFEGLLWQAFTAAFQGQLHKAGELEDRAVQAELSRSLRERASDTISLDANRAAFVGNCREALEVTGRAAALPHNEGYFFRTGLTLALCDELSQAQSLVDEFIKQFPKNEFIAAVSLPVIRAAIEIRRNNPSKAIELLQSANRYDKAFSDQVVFRPEYFRGQAYLAQRKGAEAAAEFQKILDRRGLNPDSNLYPRLSFEPDKPDREST